MNNTLTERRVRVEYDIRTRVPTIATTAVNETLTQPKSYITGPTTSHTIRNKATKKLSPSQWYCSFFVPR